MLNDLQEKQRIILHYDDHGNLQKYESKKHGLKPCFLLYIALIIISTGCSIPSML